MVKTQQDRQCTHNVTMRHVRETVAAVEKQQVLHISLCIRACARAACECECVHSSMCECECTGAGVCLRTCSLNYPACNAPPYCQLRSLVPPHTFRHYLKKKGAIFGKKLLNIKCVF